MILVAPGFAFNIFPGMDMDSSYLSMGKRSHISIKAIPASHAAWFSLATKQAAQGTFHPVHENGARAVCQLGWKNIIFPWKFYLALGNMVTSFVTPSDECFWMLASLA